MLERHEHGHQLRDARDRDAVGRVVLREHVTRGRVHNEERARVDRRSRRVRRRCGGNEQEARRDGNEPAVHGAQIYLTRMRWPTVSAFELTPGLSSSSCSTVVPFFDAIEPNVSPLSTE